ncbi:MAG: type III ribulose-bisphosphate carboxylase [Candidatus Lokiarchaeota archaeon]|nr:type III ribulose-bisphosphate carboxylase [Candidatus Lokiarchaeota archaeon]
MLNYLNLNYSPSGKDLVVMYYVEKAADTSSLEKAAEEIAKESSIGTWTEIATLSEDIAQRLKPSVYHIDEKENIIKIAYNEELFEADNIPQILSAIAGNIYGMKAIDNLRLIDIEFPKSIVNVYKGPKFGIKGIRKLLKVFDRPLLGTIVKPKVGLNPKQHAKVCGESWLGGLDIVKDDENLTSMRFNKFETRVKETIKIRDKIEIETGEKKIYMPNITAPVSEMKKRADFVIEQGGEYIMVDIITLGFSALQEIRDYLDDKNVVIHAHRAMHAALTRNQRHGMSMLAIAKISRLIGMDQLHTGTVVGKMEGGKEEVVNINNIITNKTIEEIDYSNLHQNWGNIRTTLPVASGGLYPNVVHKLIDILGKDIVIQAGGGVHGHPEGTEAGAKAMRQAVQAYLDNINLSEYAKTHNELKKALEKWKYLK